MLSFGKKEVSVSNQDKKASRKKGGRRRLHKIELIIAASLVGVSTASITAALVAYDAFFPRYERPDYSLYPGMYCYERFEGTLPRETFTVLSGEVELAAYYYPVESPKGLVVVVHGIHAGADDYLPLIEAMVKGGYAVLAYDATGTYSSGGDSGVGMCQQLKDLDAVLSFLSLNPPYADMPKLLIGHSWGGYAATSVLALHSEVKACVGLAPMCDGTTIMIEKSEEYVDKLAYTAKPIFDAYQKHLFGDYTKYNAVVGINATDIPVLIAQGVDDTVITPDGQSVTAHLDELENPNVTVYYGKGLQGTHTGIWHSVEAEEYVLAVQNKLLELAEQKGDDLTEEEVAAFYETVDHRLYSDVNGELIALIFETFEAGLSK